ncbi:hypothetical protein VaNZ11_006585 [Volvox africanus]|uniref:SAM-dependent MTase RsmB/NOP-type domain-containing protein n=1 Tax=Volvox africanus TaxID=51714 RepID=A0ABQ5S115_9CHLO|nr:hypothetical protein VaNZ11_006585 [Volvox africanus]
MANQHYGVRAAVRWDPAVEAYFTACFGAARLAAMSAALARPSLTPTLRVNTLRSKPQDVIQKLQHELCIQQQKYHRPNNRNHQQHHGHDTANTQDGTRGRDGEVALFNELQTPATNTSWNLSDGGGAAALTMADGVLPVQRTQSPTIPTSKRTVRLHPRLPAVAVVFGSGPWDIDCGPGLPEVVINRFAGEAVFKGAHVYAPGVLAASGGIAAGDLVAVSAALERPVGHNEGQCADANAVESHLLEPPDLSDPGPSAAPSCGTGIPPPPRLAVGISRGAKVQPDGSVPLSWARQTPPRKLQRLQGSAPLRQLPLRQPQQQELRRRRKPGKASGAECCEGELADGSRAGAALSTETECVGGHGSSSTGHGSSSNSCSVGSISDSRDVLSSDNSEPGSSSTSSCSKDSESSTSGSSSCRQDRIFLGVARAALGRRAMFRAHEGLALHMERRLYDVPSCNGLLRGEVMLQALPSIVAAQVLNPRPGTSVLDMCAAPGGKTTLLAALMSDQGRLVALDRTATKVAEIKSLARDLGVHCVEAYQADATEAIMTEAAAAAAEQLTEVAAVGSHSQSTSTASGDGVGDTIAVAAAAIHHSVSRTTARGAASMGPLSAIAAGQLLGPPPYPAGTFDHILLDPPCSALGLRPRLLHSWTLPQLRAMAAYQRSLIHTAVRLLAPGGEMVYCTCTINPDENEANVAWALDRFSGSLKLLPAEPLVGLTGVTGADPETGSRWLSEQEAAMVQRFDPGQLFPGRRTMAPTPPSPSSALAAGGSRKNGGKEPIQRAVFVSTQRVTAVQESLAEYAGTVAAAAVAHANDYPSGAVLQPPPLVVALSPAPVARAAAPTATIVDEDDDKGLMPHNDERLWAAMEEESNASDPAVHLTPPPLQPYCWSLGAMGALPLPPSPPPHQQVEEEELDSRSSNEEDSPWMDDVMGFFIARFQKVA